ncbi:MAG: cache domain-containing protein, partial [Methanoregula sp.]|nr:cache domain-containing protein [Methanoregula sp.]
MFVTIRTLTCALLIFAFLSAAGCTNGAADTKAIPTPTPTVPALVVTANPSLPSGEPVTPDEVRAFVDSAAMYAQQNGKTAALAAFNDPKGPFVKGSVYVYALDYNGITLALPFQRDLVGQDFSALSDAMGQKFVKTEIGLAKNGGGFILFEYPNPAHSNTIEPKLSYVRP